MGYSWAGGKMMHEKNQKQKILWHCPFKVIGRRGLIAYIKMDKMVKAISKIQEKQQHVKKQATLV